MSQRFVLSSPAARDLDEILCYLLEQSGPERAQHVLEHLYETFQRLAEHPGIGHRREDLTSLPVLFWLVWPYLIVYKAHTRPLAIVRVLHGARDIEALLGEVE